ncbi:thiamine phosphate synthase [Pelistega sp. NLN82]|uniref:Thiamine-phosphate synthase n=1 Tax=Pelistega ratti TaxID=2652177 RepID=A0A6L9Y4X2_9BURK|nr:thiamine phosphate synthase [Pelistega ratti]NEN75296.1 thiamine phosphate synthase [Pelistega ratti]
MHTLFPSGLYGITPEWTDFPRLLKAIEQVCLAGIPTLQWRRKGIPFEQACEQAAQVLTLCQNSGTLLVINDDWKLALHIGAPAVHIGKDDGNILHIQKTLTQTQKSLLIGVSCYNQLSLAQQAIQQGADYVAFGAVFPSSVKPNAVTAPLDLFSQIKTVVSNPPPVIGIGGITLQNAHQVIQAGADSIAVISGLFEQDDIRQTCQDFIQLFKQNNHD